MLFFILLWFFSDSFNKGGGNNYNTVLYLNPLIYSNRRDTHKFYCLVMEVIVPMHFRNVYRGEEI